MLFRIAVGQNNTTTVADSNNDTTTISPESDTMGKIFKQDRHFNSELKLKSIQGKLSSFHCIAGVVN